MIEGSPQQNVLGVRAMSANQNWMPPRDVSVVVDNDSWILPHAERLVALINGRGDHACIVRSYAQIPQGTVAFFLGCSGIAPSHVLERNRYNVVVHESALPKGRGFAPVAWQIIAGENSIPVSLFEASADADAGPIYQRGALTFEGHELCDEIRRRQGETTVRMCLDFLAGPEPPAAEPQHGSPTWYRRRTADDSRLDAGRSIAEQFDLLRTVDNERYPAFFDIRGHRYVLKIFKVD